MLDLAFFAETGITVLCIAVAIILVVNRDVWLPAAERIVSIVSGGWSASVERARAQKARRERIYTMSSADQNGPVPAAVPGAVPGLGTAATNIDLAVLASNLTEAEYIELGARLVDRRGKFVFSGKTLYKIAGGNHDEFLANMRRWRGTDIADDDPPVHVTPIVGRPTRAVFETDPDYPYKELA